MKQKYGGINLVDSDILLQGKPLCIVTALGFVGGWVAGALGLGGGSIYNPVLLAMGVPPKVSSATGLYLVSYSTFAASLIFILNDSLDIRYGLWISLWSVIGTLFGLCAANWYMKKSGRQSIIVWCLVIIFVLSTIAIPLFGGMSLHNEWKNGADLMLFKSPCKQPSTKA
jgi:uncharacterized membrane protein YfcA